MSVSSRVVPAVFAGGRRRGCPRGRTGRDEARESSPVRQLANLRGPTVVSMRRPQDAEIRPKRGWTSRVTGILSGYPVLPIEIANRLGGSKYGRTRTSRNPARRHELRK